MKKTDYVDYVVTVEQEVSKGKEKERVPMRLTGIVRDTPHKLGKIFMQHLEALNCVAVTKEEYYPIYI